MQDTTRLILCSFVGPEPVEAAAALMASAATKAAAAEGRGEARAVSWTDHEAAAQARRLDFAKHFKLTKEEVALMDRIGRSAQPGGAAAAPVASLSGLEAAVLSRVGIQGHEKEN